VKHLRRFWFPIPGHLGIGVTAATQAAARELAERTRVACWPDAPPLGAVVEDVDVGTLDQGHVIPNMRPAVWPGVWYSAL
jgi:ADP-ribose pyrophosphatase YjhB (NUDIX family)